VRKKRRLKSINRPLSSDGVKPGSAQLKLEPNFLLLLEKLEPKNQQARFVTSSSALIPIAMSI
jgi:hypothetical protein